MSDTDADWEAMETLLLGFIEKAQGEASWYNLAMRLSRTPAPRVPDMMMVLRRLVASGLICRFVIEGSPEDRWELTEEGRRNLRDRLDKR
jgi:PadR family transcriptional regulator PadR